jgi:signal transduction histidine kinase
MESLKKSTTCNVLFAMVDESIMPSLDSKVEMTAFRIFQEMLNNAVKHANAQEISVEIQIINGFIGITVKDNGQGFDIDRHLDKPGGLGLQNIRKRALMIEGAVTITSSNLGTNAQLLFPVKKNEVI